MFARTLRRTDLDRLKELSTGYNIDWSKLVDVVVIEDEDGVVVGFGSLHATLECVFAIEPTLSHLDRVDAFGRAIVAMEISVSRTGYKEIHAFVKEKSVALTLEKRFHFEPCEGASLVRHMGVTDGKE